MEKMSKKALAEMMAEENYKEYRRCDYALPQQWLDWFVKETGLEYEKVRSSTVWVYTVGFVFGIPFSSDDEVQETIWELKEPEDRHF